MEELTSAKKAKEDLEKVSKKLANTADKKAKEAEKQKDSTAMKALLVESNATRSRSEEIQKKELRRLMTRKVPMVYLTVWVT